MIEDFTQQDVDRTVQKLLAILSAGKRPATSPQAWILGGQPGAGKNMLVQIVCAQHPDAIEINGDCYRKWHPKYHEIQKTFEKDAADKTQPFSNAVTNELIRRLSDNGYSLTIEGTLRTTEVPLKTREELAAKGYRVTLMVMQVHPVYSYLGTLRRYEEMRLQGATPRETKKEAHDLVCSRLACNLSALYESGKFSDIQIYNRAKTCLYTLHSTPDQNPAALFQ